MYETLRTLGYVVINPINQLALLILIVLALAYYRNRWLKFFAATTLIHILFFGSQAGLFVTLKFLEQSYDLPRKAEPLDAVVVLSGATVQFDPVLSIYKWHVSSARIMEGIRLYKASGSQYLVITGSTPDYTGPLLFEADSMMRLAKEWGVPEDKIVVESNSKTTAEHPVELKAQLTEKNISNFYLVTSAYHQWRATKVFEKQGYHPVPFPVDEIYRHSESFFSSHYYFHQKLALKEWLGLIVYKVQGWI